MNNMRSCDVPKSSSLKRSHVTRLHLSASDISHKTPLGTSFLARFMLIESLGNENRQKLDNVRAEGSHGTAK